MWRAVVLLSLAGCPRTDAVASVPSTAPVAPASVAAPVVTAEKLDAWLRYHQALDAQTRDAGAVVGKQLAVLERGLRQREGLTEAELDLLEDCIAAVVAQRTIAKLTGAEAVKDFERATLGLKPEQRQKVEAALGDVRQKAQHAASLDAERARFGDEAVNLVLAREAELTTTWNSLLDGRGDRR